MKNTVQRKNKKLGFQRANCQFSEKFQNHVNNQRKVRPQPFVGDRETRRFYPKTFAFLTARLNFRPYSFHLCLPPSHTHPLATLDVTGPKAVLVCILQKSRGPVLELLVPEISVHAIFLRHGGTPGPFHLSIWNFETCTFVDGAY